MNILDFFICDKLGFLQAMSLIKTLLNIIRFVIPIIIIVLIIKDLIQNVIDPNNKDGIKKIKNRLIAAVAIFLVPTIIDLFMNLLNKATDSEYDTNYKLSSCYTNANNSCIEKVQDYLNCKDASTSEVSNCKNYRQCNDYSLTTSCEINTVEKNDCQNRYKDSKYTKFKK